MNPYNYTIDFFRAEYSYLYISLFLLSFFLIFNTKKIINNIFTIIISILYGIVIGTRDISIGVDTLSYYNIFISNREIPGDKFFSFFTKLSHIVISNPSDFILLLSLIFYSLLALFCIKKTASYGNSTLLFLGFISVAYMFEVSTNVIRQGISIAIFLLSLCYLGKTKIKFYLLSLLSILFHFSSIIMLLFFFITKIMKLKIIVFIYLVSILLYFFNVSLVTIASITFQYIPYIKNIDPRIGFWASGEAINYYGYIKSGILGYIIINTFLMFCYFILYKAYSHLFDNDFYIKYFMLLSSLLVLAKDFPFPDRIGVFSWFLIPLLFEPLLRGRLYVRFIYLILMVSFFFSWSIIRAYY
ncbi:EpsG family protein [Providencia stuartii]